MSCPNCDQCAVCGETGIRVDPAKLAALLNWYDDALQSWEGHPMPSEILGKHVLSEFVGSLPRGVRLVAELESVRTSHAVPGEGI